jgi:hypothetical protein
MSITLEKQQVMFKIWQLVKELTPSEKLFLSEQLTATVRNQLPDKTTVQQGDKTRVRLSNYAGVGAELWQTVDVEQYINQERDAWQT